MHYKAKDCRYELVGGGGGLREGWKDEQNPKPASSETVIWLWRNPVYPWTISDNFSIQNNTQFSIRRNQQKAKKNRRKGSKRIEELESRKWDLFSSHSPRRIHSFHSTSAKIYSYLPHPFSNKDFFSNSVLFGGNTVFRTVMCTPILHNGWKWVRRTATLFRE